MPDISIHARAAAVRIVRRLQEKGYVAYLAGGCVRDTLLGRVPTDYDVATDAEPPRVKSLFRGARLVGEAFGVLLLPMRERGRRFMVEVSTFRRDWGYTDGRRPTGVTFSDARHDAERRDFTINGLFENPLASSGSDPIIDYVKGRDDLAKGIVRAIGNPEQRFGEDYLRMLRAVRFAARFSFQIESATRNAIVHHADRLGQISPERIGQETRAMLSPEEEAQPSLAVRLIQALHLDETVLGAPHADPPIPTVDALPSQAHYTTVLAGWLLDRKSAGRGSEACACLDVTNAVAPLRTHLCLSNDQQGGLTATLDLARRAMAWPTLSTAPRKRLMADRAWPQALLLLNAYLGHVDPRLCDLIAADPVTLSGTEIAPDPFVHGEDLIALGIDPGPGLGRLIDGVYDAQLEGRVTSRDDALDWLRRHR